MRPTFLWHPTLNSTLAVALVTLSGTDALACSGPGAHRTMAVSELIGWSSAGLSIAMVVAGCKLVRRRDPSRPIRWVVAPLALHPRWWIGSGHGDCGFALRFWAVIGTLGIALVVLLAVLRPPAEAEPKRWRWELRGALIGGLAGLPLAGLILTAGPPAAIERALAGAVLGSIAIAGALIGGDLFRSQTGATRRSRLCLRTRSLLPFVLIPLYVVLLPLRPYEASTLSASPFRFVVVDEATGQPIPNASVQILNPRFALDDDGSQGKRVLTGADGDAAYDLYVNIHGREGLLGCTETLNYNPQLIRVEAPGYRPVFTSLANDPTMLADQLTAPPLGMTHPPPSSVTIRLSPIR